jgi:hypothetical protein
MRGDFGDYVEVAAHDLRRQERTPAMIRKRKSSPKDLPAQQRRNVPSRIARPACSASGKAERSNPDVSLTLKHFHRRTEAGVALKDGKRLYLRVGDEVNHLRYDEWGIGVVMEVMTSSVPGGTCLARVRFQDGQLRCFNNDLDNEACCYYFGVRRYWNPTHGVEAIRSKMFFGG